MLRLFQTGHLQEERIFEDLRRIGVEVHSVQPKTGKQYSFWDLGGHFGGSMDAAIRGVKEAPKAWAVCEVKTANEKNFKKLTAKGVKVAQPKHYAQMQTYMALAKIKRAAYFAVSKNTDAIHFEWIHFDSKAWEQIRERARQVITSPEPLTRYSVDPFKPPCGWCDARELCHEEQVPPVNCRTCAHSTPLTDGEGGRWHCAHHDRLLSTSDQELGCDEHLYIPALVPFAKPIDGGDGFVLYEIKKKPGQRFLNQGATSFPAIDAPHLTSAEVQKLGEAGGQLIEEKAT